MARSTSDVAVCLGLCAYRAGCFYVQLSALWRFTGNIRPDIFCEQRMKISENPSRYFEDG